MAAAKRAKEAGSTRFCMGAAWRELGNKKKAFNNILDMVSEPTELHRCSASPLLLVYFFDVAGLNPVKRIPFPTVFHTR